MEEQEKKKVKLDKRLGLKSEKMLPLFLLALP